MTTLKLNSRQQEVVSRVISYYERNYSYNTAKINRLKNCEESEVLPILKSEIERFESALKLALEMPNRKPSKSNPFITKEVAEKTLTLLKENMF